MKIDNLSELALLVHAARIGSLTGAARMLGVTPAAASATLKRVEAKLGARLFERSTRSMRLTGLGQTLLEYAGRALDLVAEGEAQIAADQGGMVGLIRLAAPSDLARSTLLPWLDEFLNTQPGVRLALSIGDRTLDVVRDEIDIALRYGALSDSRLVARRLITTHPVVVAAPAYLARHGAPKTPLDLADHNCLAYDRGGRPHRTWRFRRGRQWTEVRVHGNRSVDDASIARQWAVDGAGILLKSPIEQRREMAEGKLVRLLRAWETEAYPLYAVLPSGRFVPRRVRALVEFVAAKFEGIAQESLASE